MKVNDEYTRKRDGVRCTYIAEYGASGSGGDVAWNARVHRDGNFVGATGGTLIANTLPLESIEPQIKTLIEAAIDTNAGLKL